MSIYEGLHEGVSIYEGLHEATNNANFHCVIFSVTMVICHNSVHGCI